MYIIIICFIVIVVLFFSIGLYLARFIAKTKVLSYKNCYKDIIDEKTVDLAYLKSLDIKECLVDTKNGYKLSMYYFDNNSNKTIMLIHGFTANSVFSLRYLPMFIKMGFNVVGYDHCYHGKSEGDFCSMGYFEKYDLVDVIDKVYSLLPNTNKLCLHGESMGASTSIIASTIDSRINLVISDCGFSNFMAEAAYQASLKYGYGSKFIAFLGSVVSKIVYKFSYNDVSPIRYLNKVNIPILFIHGDSDTFTPKEHSVDMYNSYSGIKELYLAKNADHVKSLTTDINKYYEVCNNFLTKHL